MEKKQKNSVVTFMMVVGVAFILVAGCIFVRQAWQYLPEAAKQFCLLAVAAGSLTGSVLVGRKEMLKKTETALFYIGDAFLGYFSLAFTGGSKMTELFDMNLSARLFVATLVMIIPVMVKLISKKRVTDYGVTVVMTNMAVIFAQFAAQAELEVYVMNSAAMTVLLLVLNHFISKDSDSSKGMKICARVCYLVQEIYTMLWIVVMSFMIEVDLCETSVYGNIAFVLMGICVVLSALIWYDKEEDVKVVQLIVTCGLLGNMLLFNLICGTITDALVLGIVAFMITVIAAMKNNRLYVVTSSITLLFIAFYITREFWLSIAWWVYMFVAGVIMVLIAVKKEKEGE